MYIPSPKNTPLFEEKGEVQIEVGASTNSIFLTGNYAFSEKYAFISNGCLSFRNFSSIYDIGDIRSYNELTIFTSGYGAHRSFEAGLGRYNIFPTLPHRIETFLVLGYGSCDYDNKDYYSEYLQGYFQMNIGKRFKHFEIGWSVHLAYSHFYCKYADYVPQPDLMLNKREIIYKNFGTINPGALLFLKFGGSNLKSFFRSGFNLTYPLTSNALINNSNFDGGYTRFHLSIGLSYRF